MLSFFPRGVLDENLNLIESVSEDFSFLLFKIVWRKRSSLQIKVHQACCYLEGQFHTALVNFVHTYFVLNLWIFKLFDSNNHHEKCMARNDHVTTIKVNCKAYT